MSAQVNPLACVPAYSDAHDLQLLITGSRLLLETVLEEMQSSNPFAERVEVLCAMLETSEAKARELKENLAENHYDA